MTQFEDKEISHVLIIIAMEAEAEPLMNHLNLTKIPNKIPFAPFELHQGEYKGKQLTVVTNGKDARFKVDNVGTTSGKFLTRWLIAAKQSIIAVVLCPSIFQVPCLHFMQFTKPLLI
jgi:hypothetical protein